MVGTTTPAVLPVPGGAQQSVASVSLSIKKRPSNLPTTWQKPSNPKSDIFLISLKVATRAEP